MFYPEKPYNDLPLLPPRASIETHAVLKKAISANRELAELKGVGPRIPNQAVILQVLGLQEAKLSSEVENIVTTNDELYQALADEGKKAINPHTKEVLCYKDALWYGYHAIKKQNRLLTAPLYEEIAHMITQKDVGVRKLPGTKLKNPFGKVIYTPPEGENVLRDKLSNLERFIYEEKGLDPLIKLAIIHYQFEAIHPFYDGNGRTGRILNILYLVDQNLLEFPILYLSRYIIEHKSDYYTCLRQVTENDAWEPWILFVLDGIVETAKITRKKILAIQKLIGETVDRVKTDFPKIYSKDLVEALFCQPYCKIRFLAEAGIAQRDTASRYLHELTKGGLLREEKIGREKYYINYAFFDLLIQ